MRGASCRSRSTRRVVAASVSDSTWADRDLGAGAGANVAAADRRSGYCRLTYARGLLLAHSANGVGE